VDAEAGRQLSLAEPAVDPGTDQQPSQAMQVRHGFEAPALRPLVGLHLLLELSREGLERIERALSLRSGKVHLLHAGLVFAEALPLLAQPCARLLVFGIGADHGCPRILMIPFCVAPLRSGRRDVLKKAGNSSGARRLR